jgi:hypothetical protein
MVLEPQDLSPEQRAAAELLLGRPLSQRESVSVQAFEQPPLTEEQKREIIAGLERIFAKVDRNLDPTTTPEEAEEIFVEAMRSSRPGFRIHK